MDSFNYLHNKKNLRARRLILNLIDDKAFKGPWRIMKENLSK